MTAISHLWPLVTAFNAGAAAVMWIYSARVTVPAPPETAGQGALMGGYLVTKLSNGRRIDLHATLERQSTWSGRAALAAAASAICSIFAIYWP
ncbi:hypothetical protein [Nitrobacter sp.]|jgi:hypothetical protein|uniref:hypothetical protein n=1 Tax=Nitrobacter sp. TaxID=29420 RepID=UPI003F64F07E